METHSLQPLAKRRRNRRRPKRRRIFCPVHDCYLDSVSPKRHLLYAHNIEQLRQQGMTRKRASLLLQQQTVVTLAQEWLEACWCPECQESKWYHIRRSEEGHYAVTVAAREQWQQADGVINPEGNPSVGEFTRRQASGRGHASIQLNPN
jgi:hypothetical protein